MIRAGLPALALACHVERAAAAGDLDGLRALLPDPRRADDAETLVKALLLVGDAAAVEEAEHVAESNALVGAAVRAAARRARCDPSHATRAVALLDETEARVGALDRLAVRADPWPATKDRVHRTEAKRVLAALREHAPTEYRDSIGQKVPLYSEVAAF